MNKIFKKSTSPQKQRYTGINRFGLRLSVLIMAFLGENRVLQDGEEEAEIRGFVNGSCSSRSSSSRRQRPYAFILLTLFVDAVYKTLLGLDLSYRLQHGTLSNYRFLCWVSVSLSCSP